MKNAVGQDAMSAGDRAKSHTAALGRIKKGGYRTNNTVTTICGPRVVIVAMQKKAASLGKSLSSFLLEAGSHYPNTNGGIKK